MVGIFSLRSAADHNADCNENIAISVNFFRLRWLKYRILGGIRTIAIRLNLLPMRFHFKHFFRLTRCFLKKLLHVKNVRIVYVTYRGTYELCLPPPYPNKKRYRIVILYFFI